MAFDIVGRRVVCFALSAHNRIIARMRCSCYRADISSAESVMENISTVVIIILVASVVVAAVACSGHGRWH